MFMPGRNNPSWTSSKKRASKAFKNADRLFYEKTQSRTQFYDICRGNPTPDYRFASKTSYLAYRLPGLNPPYSAP